MGGILRQYPAVTRLIRAYNGTGNVQLHYAVSNGNAKAIRRIVRADPGCALIRNIQVRRCVVLLEYDWLHRLALYLIRDFRLCCLSFRDIVLYTSQSRLVTLLLFSCFAAWSQHLQKCR